MNIEIYPLKKVVIDGVSISLGMEKSDVEALLGNGDYDEKLSYYYNDEMLVAYDEDGKVEFIEFLGGIDGELRPTIDGISIFDAPADDLVDFLNEKNQGKIDNSEEGYSLAFLNLSVGVYREVLVSEVLEMMEEMKADGIDIDNNEEVQVELETEMRKANHWATFGIGIEGYYDKLKDI